MYLQTPVEDEWCFDPNQMLATLDSENPLQVIIRGHLYVDHILMEMMTLGFKVPSIVKADRMNFLTKTEICAGLGILRPNLIPPIKRLNLLRNKAAHDLKWSPSELDKKRFFDSFETTARDAILEEVDTGQNVATTELKPRLSQMLIVLIVFLDMNRNQFREFLIEETMGWAEVNRRLNQPWIKQLLAKVSD